VQLRRNRERQHFGNILASDIDIIRAEGATMTKIIQCPCGVVIEGRDDEDVVKQAQEHARQVHQMDLTREQALAMARPA
jgi:predicted small metal-binding protein